MSTTAVSNRDKLAKVLAGLSDIQIDAVTPLFEDVAEAARTDNCLNRVSRDKFRRDLNLKRLLNPTITELVGIVLAPKDTPLADRINDGDYKGGVNSDITAERFPITHDAGPVPLVLADFGSEVSSEEVEQWCQADGGYEVAYPEDGLAVGATSQHQHLQLQNPIVVLGGPPAFLGGARRVLYFFGWGDGRRLHLHCYGSRWYGYCRFLLRKVSKPSGS